MSGVAVRPAGLNPCSRLLLTGVSLEDPTLDLGDRLMTASDLAERLSVPVSRVYDCWRLWGIPALKIGQHLRFRPSDVESWLDQQLQAAV